MPAQNLNLEEYLLKENLITGEKLKKAKTTSKEEREPLSKTLIKLKYLSEDELLKFTAKQYNLPYLKDIKNVNLQQEEIDRLPLEYLKKNSIVPLEYQNNILKIAASNPLDLHLIDNLRSFFPNSSLEVMAAPTYVIEKILSHIFDKKEEYLDKAFASLHKDYLPPEKSFFKDEDLNQDAPLIKAVNSLISQAVKIKATDIHLQPRQQEVALRYRIDGILYDYHVFPKKVYPEIISRIKVIAKLDITETRNPQDGRFSVDSIPDKKIDVRVSIIPTSFGERIVLRMLDKTQLFIPLEKLGVSPEQKVTINKYINFPNGLILVNGPTGSGKTTSLYAFLDKINKGERNILTIEDPIEYNLEGISQTQVEHKTNLSFFNGLRSMLRQDPDVIMIGEIRDKDTADVAIRASLTGHLVLTTLHTNDTLQAITRLMDIGIEPYLISSSISLSLAQRLLRILCPKCKQPLSKAEKEMLPEKINDNQDLPKTTLFKAKGCPECFHTGFKGRTAIYEILEVSAGLRELINQKASYKSLKDYLKREKNFTTLKEEGLKKIRQGITTFDEVMRVTSYI